MTEGDDITIFSSLTSISKFLSLIDSSIDTVKPIVDRVEKKYRHLNSIDGVLKQDAIGDIEKFIEDTHKYSNELRHISNRLRGLGYASLDYRQQADTISAMVKEKLTEA